VTKHQIKWQHFPKNVRPSEGLELVLESFGLVVDSFSSHEFEYESNNVLAKVRPALEQRGFKVESSKKSDGKISLPVLFGVNGKVEKSFEADAFHENFKVIVEVEAGRAISNWQILKDLFESCVVTDAEYLAIAVRQVYKTSKDFDKAVALFETLDASDRLKLPLKGILIVGY